MKTWLKSCTIMQKGNKRKNFQFFILKLSFFGAKTSEKLTYFVNFSSFSWLDKNQFFIVK